MELKNKCDAVEKRETEKRQLEEKKHQEELQSLKKTNQQLKVRPSLLHSSSLISQAYTMAFVTCSILPSLLHTFSTASGKAGLEPSFKHRLFI